MEKATPGNKFNDQILKSHIITNRILSSQNVNVYNTTLGGELEVYPRVNFFDVISGN